ncbi:KTSC domain-containing protein [Rhizobium mesosinicum]|uniref:KTSC domain-containing protein n=1 Tax=Rhizobium mesosinicum TaxID=335017 RepID=A0ABS7H1X5_9HYPH|nr:KTSC domain-containing protein [Rhizobium mesosinicum]MBW9056298.1 KTSC domain-containing protein [Rhizobium mesosinicum]
MHEVPVKSRIIQNVYFSQEDGRLRIRFRNGEERLFDGVPADDVSTMVAAPSPGQYYIDRIRTRYRRIAA